jgi:hypothetical protein
MSAKIIDVRNILRTYNTTLHPHLSSLTMTLTDTNDSPDSATVRTSCIVRATAHHWDELKRNYLATAEHFVTAPGHSYIPHFDGDAKIGGTTKLYELHLEVKV